MKRMLALLTVGALSALVIGSAAALTVDGGVIQAGVDSDLTCDDAVEVDGWGTDSENGLVSFVRIAGIDDECVGSDILVDIRGEGGTNLTDGGPVEIVAGEADENATQVPFDSPVAAEEIVEIFVVIET